MKHYILHARGYLLPTVYSIVYLIQYMLYILHQIILYCIYSLLWIISYMSLFVAFGLSPFVLNLKLHSMRMARPVHA